MPEDQIVKAVGDLLYALRQRISICRKEEMEVLQKMNNIMSNATLDKVEPK